MRALRAVLRDETGASAIEYATIASLVSIAAFAVIGTIGGSLEDFFLQVANGLAPR